MCSHTEKISTGFPAKLFCWNIWICHQATLSVTGWHKIAKKKSTKWTDHFNRRGEEKEKRGDKRRRIRPELSSFIYVCCGRRSPYCSSLLHLWISLITTRIANAYYGCVIFFDEKRNFCKISKLVLSLTAYLMKWIIEFEIFSDDLMRLIIEHDFFLQIIQ